MDGKVALEEHFSTELNNRNWNAKGEEDRNGKNYAQDVERSRSPNACRWNAPRTRIGSSASTEWEGQC